MTPSTDPRRDPRADDGGLTLLGIVNILLRRWRIVLLTTVLVTAISVAAAWLSKGFQVTSTFMPQTSESGAAGLAGLAAQFGISVGGGGGGGESLNFYAELPTSRDILRDLARTPLRLPGGDSGSVMDYFEVEGETPDARLRAAVTKLEQVVTASPDLKANTVIVRTEARHPRVAELMNRRLLDLINTFNLERRQSRASNERRFTQQRMDEARSDLATAEERLQRFLTGNRMLMSPQLQYERLKLERDVQVQQEVYLSLRKAYEEARIDEVRDTPVITVIETPEGAARPAGTGRALGAVIGLVVGGLLGVILAFMVEFVRRQRLADPDAYAEFERLRRFGRRRSALSGVAAG
jgi:uncharacterized protein involved in exopolysaccharide biosynthesis